MFKKGTNNNRWLRLLLVLIVAFLVLSIVVVLVLNNNRGKVPDVNNNPDNEDEIIEQIEQDQNKVKAIIESGVDNYIAYQKSQVEAATTNEEKAEIYAMTAWELYEMQTREEGAYTDEILDFARMAEQLNPTARTAYDLSVYEKELGDSSESQKYYDLSIERGLNINVKEGRRNNE